MLLFLQGHFCRVNFEFKGKYSHVPLQFVKNSYLKFCKVYSAVTLFR